MKSTLRLLFSVAALCVSAPFCTLVSGAADITAGNVGGGFSDCTGIAGAPTPIRKIPSGASDKPLLGVLRILRFISGPE